MGVGWGGGRGLGDGRLLGPTMNINDDDDDNDDDDNDNNNNIMYNSDSNKSSKKQTNKRVYVLCARLQRLWTNLDIFGG